MQCMDSNTMCVRQENRMNEKIRCDISDIGNRIVALLEYLSKKQRKKQENLMFGL